MLTFAGLEDVRVRLVHWLPELEVCCRDGGVIPRRSCCSACRTVV